MKLSASQPFVVSHGDAPVILEAPEHAFDAIAVLVSLSVEGVGLLSIGLVWNDGLDVLSQQTGAPMVGVIGIVGEQVARPGQMAGEHDGALDVGGLPGCQIEGQGPALFVAQGMDLGVSSAFSATDGLSRSPPFSAAGTAMRLDVGGVDGDLFRRPGQGLRQSREQVLPMAALRPAVIAIVNSRRRAVSRRAVPPPAARLENVNDAADDPPVILAPLARRVVRKMRLDRRPLLVRKPKLITHASKPPSKVSRH